MKVVYNLYLVVAKIWAGDVYGRLQWRADPEPL